MLLIIALLILLIGGAAVLFLLQGINPPPPTATGNGDAGAGQTDAGGPPAQATQEPDGPAGTATILVASRDIRRGARLSAEDVQTMAWPVFEDSPLPPGAFEVADAEDVRAVEGRIARVDILHGQPILDHLLSTGSEPEAFGDTGSDAALMIPQGMVAYSIPITRLSAVAYALRPGDHVDIMMSFRFVDVDEDFQTITPNQASVVFLDTNLIPEDTFPQTVIVGREEPGPLGTTLLVVPGPGDPIQRPRQATQIMVDNAIVLRVGTFPLGDAAAPIIVTAAPPPTPDSAAEGQDPNQAPTPLPTPIPEPTVITLVMPRQDALVLKYALETGSIIDLVLRSYLDDDVQDITTETVTLRYIVDFYNLTIPPRMPVAQDPRIDALQPNLQPPGGVTGEQITPEPGDFE
jgi:pilus assembly protein CpaB